MELKGRGNLKMRDILMFLISAINDDWLMIYSLTISFNKLFYEFIFHPNEPYCVWYSRLGKTRITHICNTVSQFFHGFFN